MKAIRLVSILLFSFFSTMSVAQTPNWLWAKVGTGTNSIGQEGYAISIDSSSNVYLTGCFWGTSASFDSITLVNGSSTSGYAFFIVKYSSTGDVLWSKTAKADTSSGISITGDTYGNVFVTGIYGGASIEFDSTHIIIDSNRHSKSFLVKYDSAGNTLWAKAVKQGKDVNATSLIADNNGSIYVTGSFADTTLLTLFRLPNYITDLMKGFPNFFVKKFSASGDSLWTRTVISSDSFNVNAYSITTDRQNNIYVAGVFDGDSLAFGNTILNAHANRYYSNSFIAKYDSYGNQQWVKEMTCRGNIMLYGITTDLNDNLFITASFDGDSLFYENDTIYNSIGSSPNAIISKLDQTGNLLWTKISRESGQGIAVGHSITTDISGNVYATGSFYPDITFDSTAAISDPSAFDAMFIVTLDPSGKVICSNHIASGGDDGSGIAVNKEGDVYVGGDFYGIVTIPGLGTFSEPLSEYAFVAKYNCGLNVGIKDANAQSSIVVYPNPSSSTFYFSGMKEADAIEVYDVMGRNTVLTPSPSPGERGGAAFLDLSGKSKGVYFYRITEQGNLIQEGKMVVE